MFLSKQFGGNLSRMCLNSGFLLSQKEMKVYQPGGFSPRHSVDPCAYGPFYSPCYDFRMLLSRSFGRNLSKICRIFRLVLLEKNVNLYIELGDCSPPLPQAPAPAESFLTLEFQY